MYYRSLQSRVALWLLVNLMLPMFLPTLILYAYSLTTESGMGFWSLFIELLNRGMYVFSGFSLTFSLFEDYDTASRVVRPYHYLIIVVALIFLIFMFIASNSVIEIEGIVKFREISDWFIFVFITLVILNTYLKGKILANRGF